MTSSFFDFSRQNAELGVAPETGSWRYIARQPAGDDVPRQLGNPSIDFRELSDRVLVVVGNA
jgi:hypothetical protein